jgi:hypothetical protein
MPAPGRLPAAHGARLSIPPEHACYAYASGSVAGAMMTPVLVLIGTAISGT